MVSCLYTHCCNRSKTIFLSFADLFHFKAVFERLQEASAKTEQDTTDAAVDMTEEMEDLASDLNRSVCPFGPFDLSSDVSLFWCKYFLPLFIVSFISTTSFKWKHEKFQC